MNAICNPDYTASLNYVSLAYESETETLQKLDSLYAGRDLVTSSMNQALSCGGNGQELLMAQLDNELDQLLLESLADERDIITISPQTSSTNLLNLRQRYADNAKRADDWETEIYSDIHSYDFEAMGIEIKSVIDFLTLQFEVNRPTTRSHIKKYLTEKTGTRFYIGSDERDIEQSGDIFTIRIHDIKSKRDLKAIINCLKHYGVNCNNVKIARIEASLDFYNAKHKALLIALYKSLAFVESSNNQRVYKYKSEFREVPKSPLKLMNKLDEGYCIGVNHRDDNTYYRSYNKTTDRGLSLSASEHRLRTEVNCSVSELGVNGSLCNLPEIIQCAFKRLMFTRLGKSATADDKNLYRQSVEMFGKRTKEHYGRSRHKRNFNQAVVKNGELNKAISRKVSDLKRNFKE